MKAFLPLILIIVAIGLFFFQINPTYSDVKLLQSESKEYDEALKTAEELKKIRTELSAKLESFPKDDLARLNNFLPRNLDTVQIILDLDGIATRNGIRVEGIKVLNTSDTVNKNNEPLGTAPTVPYNTVESSFKFSTTYGQGIQFIQDIQRSLRLLDVTTLSIKPSQANSSTIFDFDIKLRGYWLNR